jgi:hypothetical protein
LSAGRNISIVENEVNCLLSARTNINITDGVISSIVDDTTDLDVKILTSAGNIRCGGVII